MILPHDFENQMVEHIGRDEYEKLAIALQETPPTSLRVNHTKAEAEELFNKDECEQVPWCDTGIYLSKRPHFTFDPLLHSGCYYVQEASSMFIAHVLNTYLDDIKAVSNVSNIVALDLCAAPGGKSTLILSVLPEGSLLISNEVMRQRANVLAENITKWGNPFSIVTNNYASDFSLFNETFDLVVCDVPCSGEGMFRKDPDSINEWSLENVEKCWKLQREIIRDIWHTLKDNGIIIYSTCTYNPHEDEENIAWIIEELGAELLSCKPQSEWGLNDTNTHFYPHKTKGEGFFIAVLRKKAEKYDCEDTDDKDYTIWEEATLPKTKRDRKDKRNKDNKKSKQGKGNPVKIPTEIKDWISDSSQFTFYEINGTFTAFPSIFMDILDKAEKSLKIVHSGIEIATTKGKKLQPCHALALSNRLNRSAFTSVDIDYPTAIAYLRTEAIQLPSETPTGYVLLTYKGHPIGFVNNIGSRANNLYPSEWKIKSTYTPTHN